MVVEVKQKHVGNKTNDKPGRSFQYSLESWRHEDKDTVIPHALSYVCGHARKVLGLMPS